VSSNVEQETESYVSRGAPTNCSGSTRTLGEVESDQAKQIKTTLVSETADDASPSEGLRGDRDPIPASQ